MNSLSKKVCPSFVSATTSGDGASGMFAYAEPLSAGVERVAKTALALLLMSKTTHEYQARPAPVTVTAGPLAASYVWPVPGLVGWEEGGTPWPACDPASGGGGRPRGLEASG